MLPTAAAGMHHAPGTMSDAAELTMVWRVAAAMALGGVIGLERELARESAGLRTHMLIAGAAALIVSLGRLLAHDFSDEQFSQFLRIDPVRLKTALLAAG